MNYIEIKGNVQAKRAHSPKNNVQQSPSYVFVNEIMDCFYWTGDMVQGILLKFGDPVSGLKGPSSLVNMLILACCQFC